MTVKDIAEIVERMRTAQRAYFRTRRQDTLDQCKRYEAEVDQIVRSILTTAKPATPNLFATGSSNRDQQLPD